jgi:hypothetical protein
MANNWGLLSDKDAEELDLKANKLEAAILHQVRRRLKSEVCWENFFDKVEYVVGKTEELEELRKMIDEHLTVIDEYLTAS